MYSTTLNPTALNYIILDRTAHCTALHFTPPVIGPGSRGPSACEKIARSGYLEEVPHALEEISVLVCHGAELVILPSQLSL